MKKIALWGISHATVCAFGFVMGVYWLPVIIAQEPADPQALSVVMSNARYQGSVESNLKGSDWLHRGEGRFYLADEAIAFVGKLTPGPDYHLYLSPHFIEDEAGFSQWATQLVKVGEIKSFDDFIMPLPGGISIDRFSTVLVWCDAFEEFITAAKFR